MRCRDTKLCKLKLQNCKRGSEEKEKGHRHLLLPSQIPESLPKAILNSSRDALHAEALKHQNRYRKAQEVRGQENNSTE